MNFIDCLQILMLNFMYYIFKNASNKNTRNIFKKLLTELFAKSVLLFKNQSNKRFSFTVSYRISH